MVNALQLNEDEVEALRGLREGASRISASHPVWAELARAGLVERRGRLCAWSLTMRGRFYKTDELETL